MLVDLFSLNWVQFQSMVNKIAKREVSEEVQIFGAKGKDKKKDAFYEGRYRDVEGKWYIQAKHSAKDLPQNSIRNALFSFIRDELPPVIKNGGIGFILATNLKTNPYTRTEIETLVNEFSQEIHFLLWDGEEIEHFLTKFTLVRLYYFNPSIPLFMDKIDWFDSLSEDIKNLALVNKRNHLEKVSNFLNSTEKKIMIISGHSGSGKTKLLYTCAKMAKNYNPIIIRNESSNFRDISLIFSLDSNPPLIFLDSTSEFPLISELMLFLEQNKDSNHFKIVLTSKPLFLNKIIPKLHFVMSEREILEVKPFIYAESEELLEKEFSITDPMLVAMIHRVSKGNPSFLVNVSNYLIKHEKITGEIIAKSLNDYGERVYNETKQQMNEKQREVIEIIAAIQPLDYRNQSLVKQIIELLGLTEIEWLTLISVLTNLRIIKIEHGKISIIPSFLGYYILSQLLYSSEGDITDFSKIIVSKFSNSCLENIIGNFGEVDRVTGNKLFTILDEILGDLSYNLNTEMSFWELNQKTSLIIQLAYYRPIGSIKFIARLIQILKEKIENNTETDTSFVGFNPYREFPMILKIISRNQDLIPDCLELLADLIIETPPKYFLGIESPDNIFSYICAVSHRKPFELIESVMKSLETWTEKEKEKQILAVQGFSSILNIESSFDQMIDEKNFTIRFVRYYLPRTPRITEIRSKVLCILNSFLEKTVYPDVKSKIIASLGKCIRSLFAREDMIKDSETTSSFNKEPDQSQIVGFIEKIVDLEENWIVKNSIYRFAMHLKKYGTETHVIESSKNLLTSLDEDKEYQLFQKFSVIEFNREPEFKFDPEFIAGYLDKLSPQDFYRLIERIITMAKSSLLESKLKIFLFNATELNLSFMASFLETTLNNNADLIKKLSPPILGAMRINDRKLYTEFVQRIDESDPKFILSLIRSLCYGKKNEDTITDEDREMIKKFIDNSQKDEILIEIASKFYPLSTYFEDSSTIKSLALNLLEKDNFQVSMEVLEFLAYNLDESVFDNTFTQQVLDIISEYPNLDDKTQYSYTFNSFSNKLWKNYSDLLINFLLDRITKSSKWEEQGIKYEIIPRDFHISSIELSSDEEMSSRIYEKIIMFLLKDPTNGNQIYNTITLLSQLTNNLDNILKDIILEKISDVNEDKLSIFAELLRFFNEDENYFDIVAGILSSSCNTPSIEAEIVASIITTAGLIGGSEIPRYDKLKQLLEPLAEHEDLKVRVFAKSLKERFEKRINSLKIEEEI